MFCYAYTTFVFNQPPGKDTNGTINVRLADALDETDASPETSREAWDRIPDETVVAPTKPELDRAPGERCLSSERHPKRRRRSTSIRSLPTCQSPAALRRR